MDALLRLSSRAAVQWRKLARFGDPAGLMVAAAVLATIGGWASAGSAGYAQDLWGQSIREQVKRDASVVESTRYAFQEGAALFEREGTGVTPWSLIAADVERYPEQFGIDPEATRRAGDNAAAQASSLAWGTVGVVVSFIIGVAAQMLSAWRLRLVIAGYVALTIAVLTLLISGVGS